MPDLTVEPDPAQHRYVALLDGELIGEAVYLDEGRDRIFVHSEIVPEEEHRGYGTEMVRSALDDTLAAGLTPVGRCSMVRHFLAEHPEYARPDGTGPA